MTWNMGVHVGPAEDTLPKPPPPQPKEEPVNTITPPSSFQPVPEPPQEIIPPQPQASPMTKAMSISPAKSTADGMWMAVQSLMSVKTRMEAETAAVNAAVTQINSRIDGIADMRKMLQDYADKLKV
jgi:hypothetical protein